MEARKKILVLIDWYLPGTKAGGPVRSLYSLLKLLSGDYDFFVITDNKDLGSNEVYSQVPSDEWIRHDNVNFFYTAAENFTAKRMMQIVQQVEPDLISLNSFWSSKFSILPVRLAAAEKIRVPVLLSPRGMLSSGAMSLKPLKKRAFLALARFAGWYRSINFHATNEQEKSDIMKRFPANRIYIAPNVNAGVVFSNTTAKQAGSVKLFYLSRVARVKNLHFALNCLKGLNGNAEIVYDVYGNFEDREYVLECEKIIKELPPNIHVTFKGELSFNKIQETLVNYHALFLPTLNENYGHSIVESLLCGCMVLISDQTPWNDVEAAGAGHALPLQQDKFSDALKRLIEMTDTQFRNASTAANNYISKKINTAKIKAEYKSMFDGCSKN